MSRARQLNEMFNALEHDDLMPPPDDMQALAVLARAQRMCREAFDRACPALAAPWTAMPARQREFSFEMQMAFLMGRAYERVST